MNLRDLASKGPKPVWIRYLLLIGFFTLITHLTLNSQFRQSAILYILIPYLVSVALYLVIPRAKGRGRWSRFLRHILAAIIVMLSTSVFLFEGIICVLMFMPIYIFFAGIAYALMPRDDQNGVDVGRTFDSHGAALIIALLSLEGISPTLSFERENTVTVTKTVNLSVEDIKFNLTQEIELSGDRSWFLSIFPLPTEFEAGSLQQGDLHKLYFTYKRWGLDNFNAKNGETWVNLMEVTETKIRTEIIKDTSYISHYLTIHGSDLDLKPISDDQTEITLAIHYRRDLDPAWYFGPMQRAAITESAEYLIDNLMTGNPT